MFSRKEYDLAISYLKYYKKFRLLPISWNNTELTSKSSKIPSKVALFQNCLQISHMLFLIYRIRKCYPDQIIQLLPNIFLMIVQIAIFSFRSPVWIYTQEYISIFNMSTKFNFQMGAELNEEGSRNKAREKLFHLILITINLAAFSAALQFMIGNILEFGSVIHYIVYLIIISPFLLELQVSINYAVIPFMTSLSIISLWLEKACILWPKKKGILSMKQSFMVYRCTLILNQLQNKTFGSIFVPLFKLCLVMAALVCSFTVINLRDYIPLPITIFFIVYLFTILVLTMPAAMIMSTIYNISSKFHRNIANHCIAKLNFAKQENICWKKVLKSFPLIRSQVGSFYFMEGYAKLTLCDNILRGITFMLITFKEVNNIKVSI